MDLRLKDHVAIVTGAGRGIGAAIATTLAEEGCHLVLCDKDLDVAEEVRNILQERGSRAIALQVDVARYDCAAHVIQTALEEYGNIHILVNNAGFSRDAPIVDMTERAWDDVVDASLKGAWAFSQAAARHMIAQRYGRIINIASRAYWGEFNKTNYASAKAGMVGLSRALALELGPHEITVNAIAPGLIRTERVRNLKYFEDIDRRAKSSTPIQRPGMPEDIADAVAFLASHRAGFITGELLHVTGGRFSSS